MAGAEVEARKVGETGRLASTEHDPGLLGVTGLAIAVLGYGAYGSGLVGEALEWRLFMLLGTVFPALIVGLALAARWRVLAAWLVPIQAVFVAIGTLVALRFVYQTWDVVAWSMALTSAILAAILHLRAVGTARLTADAPREPMRALIAAGASFLALLATTHAALRVQYWLYPPSGPLVVDLTQPPTPATVFSQTGVLGLGPERVVWLLALVLAVGFVLNRPVKSPLGPWATRGLWALAVAFLGAASLRVPDLDRWRIWHHWGVIVGPADLVRDGGVLLWNVPSQYGFLNTLLIAFLPTETTWASARLVNAGALAASALFLFGVFFAIRRSLAGFALAVSMAFVAVFVLPGETENLDGPFTYPSLAAYRFCGVYGMLGVALWESRLASIPHPTPRQRWAPLLVGSVSWVLCALWSIESGIYATATWLPALVWSRFLLARREDDVFVSSVRGLGAPLLPLELLAGTVLCIWVYYRAALGLDPDFPAYAEYAMSFRGAFFSMPFDPLGPGLTMLVVFLILSAALTRAFSHPGAGSVQVVALAAWGAAWSVSSYFVPRSHPAVGTAMMPLMLASFGVLWLANERNGWWRAPVLRWAGSGWIAVLLFAGTYDLGRIRSLGPALVNAPLADLQEVQPRVGDDLAELLFTARVRPNARIVFIDPGPFPTMLPTRRAGQRVDVISQQRPWIPIAPGALGAPLSEERRREYVDRYLLRDDVEGGWLIQRRNRPFLGKGYLWKMRLMIDARYEVTKTFENDSWVLQRCERRDTADPEARGQPRERALRRSGVKPPRRAPR